MLDDDLMMLLLAAFLGVAVAALVYAVLYRRIDSAAHHKRLQHLAAPVHAPVTPSKKNDPAAARRRNIQAALKDIELKQKSKAGRAAHPPLRLRLQQAGLKIPPSRFYLFSAVAGVIFLLLGIAGGLPPLLCAGLAVVGGVSAPRFAVARLRKKRQKAFTEELPNAVEVIVRGVKAGLPLNECLRMIALEAKEPLRSEFRTIVEAQALGLPLDEAVGRLYERMPLPEANFFAIVIAIQSKAGGNLSEALGNLANVLRARKKMRAKIVAMSSEAKASAGIIGSMPVIVSLLVYLTSPDYIALLWTDPRGQVVLGASALVMGTGIMVMRRMINFDI